MDELFCCCGQLVAEPAGWCGVHLPGMLCARCVVEAATAADGTVVCPSRLASLRATATLEEGVEAAVRHGPVVRGGPRGWYHVVAGDRLVLAVDGEDLRSLAGDIRVATELGGLDPYDLWLDAAGIPVTAGGLTHRDHETLGHALGSDPEWLRELCAACGQESDLTGGEDA